MRRARNTADRQRKVTQERATEWIAEVTMRPLDATTVGRLERLTVAPSDEKRRRVAYLLCLLYGVDPGDLDLTDEDGPGGDRVANLVALSTTWYRTRGHPHQRVVPAQDVA